MSEPLLRVISLGAGVQSTTLYLMACDGELGPYPEYAIFADTGWEPAGVYRHFAVWPTAGLNGPFDLDADSL